jgi:hypothetical protein
MPATYEPIATNTLGSATQTVTFSSIPQTYTDIVLIVSNVKHSYPGTDTVRDNLVQFNADTGGNYSITFMYGDTTGTGTIRNNNISAINTDYPMASANAGGLIIANIQNYSNSTTYKTVIQRTTTSTRTSAYVNLWRNTDAITSMVVGASGGYTLSAGTVITLYGIKAA